MQVDATADAGEAPVDRVSAAAPDKSAPASGGKTRKRQVADDAAVDQRPAKRRPTRRVSDIPGQGRPAADDAAVEAADAIASGADVVDLTEQELPPPARSAAETSADTSAGAEALPKQPSLTAKRKRAVPQAAVVSAAQDEEVPSAAEGQQAAKPAVQTAAAIGASAAEPRGTPATQPFSQRVWLQQKHKQQQVSDTAATQQPAPTVKAKAINGEQAASRLFHVTR